MKVSIITIVFNNKVCIADCIKSILNQTYLNIEYILIDGGSTDGTQEEILPYIDKLAYYISEKDNGLYDALNKGIEQATGDIIGILHSDDILYCNNTIQTVVDAFIKYDTDIVYGNGQYVDKNDINQVKRIYPSKAYKKMYLPFGWIPLHTTIYVRKELFKLYGLYDTQYSICSDYEISLRWFSQTNIKTYFIDTWVVKMRLGGKSTTPSLQKKKSTEDYAIIRRYKLWGLFTLGCKIGRKIPQYILPRIIKYK
ncbi:MAG: glycosyltransferase family 2 protein [Paludibacter sp.]|nr:glycosyltransferase family 2 protein [Paludibacter sp.]